MISLDESTSVLETVKTVRYAKTRITVVQGPNSGLSVETDDQAVRVGTAPGNDLVLTDKTVSHRHCAIEPRPGGFRVRDEKSTNGIYLADTRLYDAALSGAAEIRIGDTLLSVVPLAETVDREQATADSYGSLLGRSSLMRELFADLARIALSNVSLLVEGETGTGKELVARSVHQQSPRAHKPYAVFDCSSVVPTLVESELFGHVKGAFTGAIASGPGVFERASGGTIFLDEIGELPRELQPRLLRVLQEHEVTPVGSRRAIPVDVRVIAATNRNLKAEVARGNFREDLYYRIAVAHVRVPPLRDRMDDLTLLVEHFLAQSDPPRTSAAVPPAVWEMFRSHSWPGNVRELSNLVQRFLVTPNQVRVAETPAGTSSVAENNSKPQSERPFALLRDARREASDAFERSYTIDALARTHGNVTRAAEIAGISRTMMQKLMRKHHIEAAPSPNEDRL